MVNFYFHNLYELSGLLWSAVIVVSFHLLVLMWFLSDFESEHFTSCCCEVSLQPFSGVPRQWRP